MYVFCANVKCHLPSIFVLSQRKCWYFPMLFRNIVQTKHKFPIMLNCIRFRWHHIIYSGNHMNSDTKWIYRLQIFIIVIFCCFSSLIHQCQRFIGFYLLAVITLSFTNFVMFCLCFKNYINFSREQNSIMTSM